MDLFSPSPPGTPTPRPPLADRIRPLRLEEIAGQEALLGPGRPLRMAVEDRDLHSLILWGPPGTGKTTLARVMASVAGVPFVPFSAVLAGIKEVREVMAVAERHQRATGRRTLVFVDEIHRFNRAQQDAFLPFVETGAIVLAGATTENPSFAINAALLSRLKVYLLQPLGPEDLRGILHRALSDPRGLEGKAEIEETALERITALAGGDARRALNTLELAFRMTPPVASGRRRISAETVRRAVDREPLRYDKAGEEHFSLISALHKSLRNSDPDAALYWLARMLEAGEDPLYVARRLIRFASEDIGTADSGALGLAVSAQQAVQFVGMPEGALALAQACVYLAAAPKSAAVYRGYAEAAERIRDGQVEPVPLHLRNAETGLMGELGYGRGYQYAHDFPEGVTAMECLPPGLKGVRFYRPGEAGFEKEIARWLAEWERRRRAGVRKPS